jgi:UPF0176 protein
MYQIAAFYKFTPLDHLSRHSENLRQAGAEAHVYGTILIAPEGINATIASTDEKKFRAMMGMITTTYGLDPDLIKWSTAITQPFKRYKVREKREIITLHQPSANPNVISGQYVEAEKWNEVISQPGMLVLDTRNTYETAIGTFDGAVDPRITTFSQFAEYVDQHLDPAQTPDVAMFCTGGIRCEKASSYMLNKGFKNVYHLKGGILKYLEHVPKTQSKWNGACFVFDERVAVAENVAPAPFIWDGATLTARPVK